MIKKHAVLMHGAQMRDCVLNIYRSYPPDDAAAIVRRLAFEVGEAARDIQGAEAAGSILYAAADAVTARLPIEDFRLPKLHEPTPATVSAPAAEQASAKPTPKAWSELNWAGRMGRGARIIVDVITSGWVIGLVTGFTLGRSGQ